ncbi:acylpyruvase FAHD1, mitochondrial isoform X1 [Drosophila willistoni]|uniref:acylpyruvase FAHD1, mitochondrial isoform X1 n=1 Tax=Drosophila willistoni TaxID=7260 RepID=UPI000C26C94F|nr:acylpyruvase FAHD1, mitochondrial isoform X1 [Drosophila willistoni]
MVRLNARLLFRMSCQNNQNLTNFINDGKKIVGVALNYMDVVKARNVAVPTAPLVFLKPTTSYLQEGHPIVLPKVFTKVAYEVELGVVIGKQCKNVSEAEAMKYVAGYCLALDLTAQCNLPLERLVLHGLWGKALIPPLLSRNSYHSIM